MTTKLIIKIIKNLDNDINVYRFSLQPKIDEKKIQLSTPILSIITTIKRDISWGQITP